MIKPAKLFFIRHSPVKSTTGFFPEHNPEAIIKKIKIQKLAAVIPKNCVWYVSPLKRAIQTADALSKYVSYSKIIEEKKLVEQNFGDWSGKKISEIWKILKKKKTKHNFSFIAPEISPPNGESFFEQCKRVSSWLESLNLMKGENVVVVTHAGTIRAVLSHVLKINPQNAIGVEILNQNLSIFEMLSKKENKHKGGRFRLLALNKEV